MGNDTVERSEKIVDFPPELIHQALGSDRANATKLLTRYHDFDLRFRSPLAFWRTGGSVGERQRFASAWWNAICAEALAPRTGRKAAVVPAKLGRCVPHGE